MNDLSTRTTYSLPQPKSVVELAINLALTPDVMQNIGPGNRGCDWTPLTEKEGLYRTVGQKLATCPPQTRSYSWFDIGRVFSSADQSVLLGALSSSRSPEAVVNIRTHIYPCKHRLPPVRAVNGGASVVNKRIKCRTWPHRGTPPFSPQS